MKNETKMPMEFKEKYEILGILNFLINIENLTPTKPSNLDITFDSASGELNSEYSGLEIQYFWHHLSFTLIIDKSDKRNVSKIIVLANTEQKHLPSNWNNILTLKDSVFIGDILFFEHEKIWIQFDSNTINIEKHDDINGVIFMDDSIKIETQLICADIADYGDKTQYSFIIKTGSEDIKSAFEKGHIQHTSDLLTSLKRNIISFSILGG